MDKEFIKDLKNFIPLIEKAKELKLNEQDTRDRLRMMLEKVFGYDPLEDITAEFNVKGTHVDYAIKIKGEIKFFIEAKKADDILKDHHVRQAANYGANNNVRYALLTNLAEFWLFRIEFGGPVVYDQIFKVNLLEADKLKENAETLWLLSKKAVKNEELEKYAKTIKSLTPENLLKALVSENVIDAIRREIRKDTDELCAREAIEKAIIAQFPKEVIDLLKSDTDKEKKPKSQASGETELCSIPGCGKEVCAKGLCTSHYQKQHYQKQRGENAENLSQEIKSPDNQPEPPASTPPPPKGNEPQS